MTASHNPTLKPSKAPTDHDSGTLISAFVTFFSFSHDIPETTRRDFSDGRYPSHRPAWRRKRYPPRRPRLPLHPSGPRATVAYVPLPEPPVVSSPFLPESLPQTQVSNPGVVY